jgi:hypothetical protein
LAIQETLTDLAAQSDAVALPAVQIPDEPSKPFGHSLYTSASTIDFSPLIAQRLQHQTKQAEKCTRTKTTKSDAVPESEESTRRQILRKFREILKESDQARAPGTTVERQTRWNIGSNNGTGNAANAAAVASAVATKVRTTLWRSRLI